MSSRRRPQSGGDPAGQAMRDREVIRASRELSAYFKGDRTEREARAALKIIKAFVRDRERQSPKDRPPLPGRRTARATATAARSEPPRAARKPRKTAKRVARPIAQPRDEEAPDRSGTK